MTFRLLAAAPLLAALAACGSADDASTEAEADTVEIPANEALEGIDDAPVIDPQATATVEDEAAAAAEEAAEAEQIEEAGDNAADTAAAAMDAMEETE